MIIMSTTAEKKYSRTYYKTHQKYRRQRIEDRKDYYHEHQKEQNAYFRDSNPSYLLFFAVYIFGVFYNMFYYIFFLLSLT